MRGAGVGLHPGDDGDPEWLPNDERGGGAGGGLRSAMRTPGARSRTAAGLDTPRRLALGFIELPSQETAADVSATLHLPRSLGMTPIVIPSPARIRARASSVVSDGVAATRRVTRRVRSSRGAQFGIVVLLAVAAVAVAAPRAEAVTAVAGARMTLAARPGGVHKARRAAGVPRGRAV